MENIVARSIGKGGELCLELIIISWRGGCMSHFADTFLNSDASVILGHRYTRVDIRRLGLVGVMNAHIQLLGLLTRHCGYRKGTLETVLCLGCVLEQVQQDHVLGSWSGSAYYQHCESQTTLIR